MSIELITGRAGEPHVDSQDVRAYQAYTAGSGRYVLHGATCSVKSANEVSIAPGEILVDGTHVRVMGDGETVTIGNGQTGYKRADIIALHYTVTGSGDSIVESMEFAVVQGSPSDTEPEDPAIPQSGSILEGVTETYIPYARVVIDGLSPQEPEMLVTDFRSSDALSGEVDDLKDSVYLMHPVVLFDKWNNSMGAGATLEEEVTNFFRIDLTFRTNDFDVFTNTVFEPSETTNIVASCVRYLPGINKVYIKTKNFLMKGKSISTASVGNNWITGQVEIPGDVVTYGDFVTIVKVVGWKTVSEQS